MPAKPMQTIGQLRKSLDCYNREYSMFYRDDSEITAATVTAFLQDVHHFVKVAIADHDLTLDVSVYVGHQ